MKLLKCVPGRWLFQLTPREQRLFAEVLGLYPVIPVGARRLSTQSHGPSLEESQHLLEEALAEQRQAHRRRVAEFLSDPLTVHATKSYTRLTLAPPHVEWLLQVLNDVRVGSWIHLGSPDYEGERQLEVTEENARHFWAREVAGAFQSVLLAALAGEP
jgi:hypothetical protein